MNAPVESFVAALGGVAAGGGGVRARRAALLLHTVSTQDREWLFAQLGDGERETLQALVSELRAIGIPRAPELLEGIGAHASPAGRPDAQAVSRLAQADVATLATVLAAEPAGLVARVIALGPWPWTGALLARLGAGHRQQVMDRLADAAFAPDAAPSALDARLLAHVEARVAQAVAERPVAASSAPAPGAGVSRHWLRRWLGGPEGRA